MGDSPVLMYFNCAGRAKNPTVTAIMGVCFRAQKRMKMGDFTKADRGSTSAHHRIHRGHQFIF